jgi:hypothetical protein
MKIQSIISAILLTVAVAPLAKADTYMETEVSPLPVERREVTTTIQSAPLVEKEIVPAPAPMIITPPANNETVVVKKHSHHLLNLGLVKVF